MSDIYFNDLEALKISIDIEKSGERFYIASSKKIVEKDKKIKDMLIDLARQEREHADTFEALYNQALGKKDKFDDTYLFEPEVSRYLSAMVQTSIFPNEEKQDEIMANIKSVEDVLRLGVQAEKDSILFYTEMIIHSKLVEAKEAFRRLLGEEKKHLTDLQEALHLLSSSKGK